MSENALAKALEELALYSTGYLELSQLYATFKHIRATPAITAIEIDAKRKAIAECAKSLEEIDARVTAWEVTP